MDPSRRSERGGAAGSFLAGIGSFFRGFGLWSTSPGLMALGALPALLVAVVVIGALVLLAAGLPALADWLTPFADGLDEAWRSAIHFVVGLALLILAVSVAVLTFTAITLAVGDPFYERIWRAVERRLGGFEEREPIGFWASVRRAIRSGAKLVGLSAMLGLGVFLLDLIPVVGAPLGFTVGALGGGWLVAIELLARAFDARGLSPQQQRDLRRRGRGRVLGFGVAVYLVFLVPFAAIVAMPAAVAGSTLVARRLLEGPGSDQFQRSDGLGRRRP